MKKQLYRTIAKFNKLILPSFGKKQLDMSKAKKWQLAIIGYRAFITKKFIITKKLDHMTQESNHVALHTASFIEIQRLQLDLNDAEIPFLTKNDSESARLAGFGSFGDHVELFVYKEDLQEASKILEKLKGELI